VKLRSLRFPAFVTGAMCLLSGCASTPQSGVEVAAVEVKVYGSGSLTVSQYEVVRRLWADSSRAAFWLPTYANEAEGIASLQTEAGHLGADGLINVICMEQIRAQWSWSTERAVLCYGEAIRVRRNQG
jgi:uncharacterized protein YbjQ (UPF0145 family)